MKPAASPAGSPNASSAAARKLAHIVFFDLKDDTLEAREKLVAGCKKHLSGHDGTLYFSVGTIGVEFRRDVNVRDFHVALHVVFRDKAAHDAYQKHPRHVKFVEECKELWKRARVFDSYLSEPQT